MNIDLNSVLLNAAVAALLAGLVWTLGCLSALRRRPGLRHALWVIVLLKLVTPPVIELSILPSWFAAPPRAMHLRAIPLNDWEYSAAPVTGVLALPARSPADAVSRIDWTALLACCSGLGTMAVLALAVRQTWRLRTALRRGECHDQRIAKIAARSAQRMGLAAPPAVCLVAARLAPLLWVRRSGPLVVLPQALVDQMSDEQLVCVTCHEIAHYQRRDHWTNLLSLLIAAACWWNPVAWWVRRELRIAQETCCDALVISASAGIRRAYAETLFQALEFLHSQRSSLPALANGFGGKTSTVLPPTEQLITIWQLVHGDASIEQIQMSRDGDEIKVTIQGTRADEKAGGMDAMGMPGMGAAGDMGAMGMSSMGAAGGMGGRGMSSMGAAGDMGGRGMSSMGASGRMPSISAGGVGAAGMPGMLRSPKSGAQP
jgi:beta-lactamase regulating signal transducer with metallopeptidase domain